jgi:hypothetical protein
MMALHRSVMKDVGFSCELYVDTYSDVSDDCETEISDSDSYILTASSRKECDIVP